MLPFMLRYNDKGHAANTNTADTEATKCIRIDSDTKYAKASFLSYRLRTIIISKYSLTI